MIRPGTSHTKGKSKPTQHVGMNTGMKQVTKFILFIFYTIFQKLERKMPTLQDYLKNRDWVGAIVYLEFAKR